MICYWQRWYNVARNFHFYLAKPQPKPKMVAKIEHLLFIKTTVRRKTGPLALACSVSEHERHVLAHCLADGLPARQCTSRSWQQCCRSLAAIPASAKRRDNTVCDFSPRFNEYVITTTEFHYRNRDLLGLLDCLMIGSVVAWRTDGQTDKPTKLLHQ